MGLKKEYVGQNEDGSPHFAWTQTPDADGVVRPVVFTGPIYGTVTHPDGTTYDVSEQYIEVAPGHEKHVSHLIGLRHEAEGHPNHQPTVDDPNPDPYVHTCSDKACGELASGSSESTPDSLTAAGADFDSQTEI